jgi:fatty acid CoA ligase FadD9
MLLEEIYELEVPVGVITHPAGSLQKLADYIDEARKGDAARPTFAFVHGRAATHVLASDITVEKFIDTATLDHAATLPPASREPPRTVLLTGANGYLGRFLCLEWLERLARVDGRLVCVVRGGDASEARQRIVEAFDSGDAELMRHFSSLAERHLEVLAGDLAERHLGLDDDAWQRLATDVDVIVHPAALVNHVLPYSQLFGPNVVGTAELIRLALSEKLKRIVNVSTVAVAFTPGAKPLDESADVRVAVPSRSLKDEGYASGYAASKWAAEVLLRDAHDRFGIPISNFRSDMILAHTRYRGQLNVPDMFTRWVYSIVRTGLAPRSFYSGDTERAHYDGLPVDFTAASIAAVGEATTRGFETYHVVNPHDDGISMDDFVDWMVSAGRPIQRIDDYEDWLRRFETALKALPERERHQSFLPLLHQLRHPMPAAPGAAVSAEKFRTAVRRAGVGQDKDIPHLSEALIRKYLSDLEAVGF